MTDQEILIWYESLESATCNTDQPEDAICCKVRDLIASAEEATVLACAEECNRQGGYADSSHIRALLKTPGQLARREQVDGNTSDGYHTFNELYEHRHALFAVVCNAFGGWKSKQHADGTMFDGWFIAGIQTADGQATYHLPLSWWERFHCPEVDKAPEWDGHTPTDVVERIQKLQLARREEQIRRQERAEVLLLCAARITLNADVPSDVAAKEAKYLVALAELNQ